MSVRLIWITGRAAAGKSTVIAELASLLRARGVTPTRYVDEDILLDLVHADTDHVHHWHPHRDHRIAFRTGHLFDQSLRVLNAQLLAELDHDGLAVIELARGRRSPPIDVTYRRALDLFDARLWPHSTVFRIDVDFAVQLRRNMGRRTDSGHGTPNDIMRDLYRDDDPAAFTDAGISITTLTASATARTNAARILATLDTEPRPHNI